jgi:hypothetical protein
LFLKHLKPLFFPQSKKLGLISAQNKKENITPCILIFRILCGELLYLQLSLWFLPAFDKMADLPIGILVFVLQERSRFVEVQMFAAFPDCIISPQNHTLPLPLLTLFLS